MDEMKPCPRCGSVRLWTIRLFPKRWIFTKYFIECRMCHWCGRTRTGKRNAIKEWNKQIPFMKWGASDGNTL